jgi:hypothetical protein
MTTVTQGHLGKVRIDLDDCKRALTRSWDQAPLASENEEILHTAVEALLRAVSTITLVLEDQEQPPVADIGCGDPTHMVPR